MSRASFNRQHVVELDRSEELKLFAFPQAAIHAFLARFVSMLLVIAGLSFAPDVAAADTAGWTGDRVATRDSSGTCYAKDGDLSSGWITEFGPNCAYITTSGTRLGVIDTAGNCYVKDGDLSASWITERSNCKSLSLSGTIIAVQSGDGYCYAKQGDIS